MPAHAELVLVKMMNTGWNQCKFVVVVAVVFSPLFT